MEFAANILPVLNSWQLNNATILEGVVTIEAHGSIKCVMYPRNGDEAQLRERYRLQLVQGENALPLSVEYTNYITGQQGVTKTSSVVYGTHIDKTLKVSNFKTHQSIVTVYNHSSTAIQINSISLCPMKTLTEETAAELSRYTTYIAKYTNEEPVTIQQEIKLLAYLNIELTEKSDLLFHLLVHGSCTSAATLTFILKTNEQEVEYSPMELDVTSGKFILGVPCNLMGMSEGESRVKLYVKVSAGTATVNSKKVQMTVDGQNMAVIYGEDIWFGPSAENDFDPCINEVFTYDHDLLEISGGRLRVKCLENQVSPMKLQANYTYGTVYSYEFNQPLVRKYEAVEVL